MCLPEGERDRERTMALETVVYPQPQDPFGYGTKDLYNYNYNNLLYGDFNFEKQEEQQGSITSFLENQTENHAFEDWNCSPPEPPMLQPHMNIELHVPNDPSLEVTDATNTHNLDSSTSTVSRPKRRRAKSRKNKEEIENQRMTHIAVERNRRKQMNEYLSVLRSLMPDSYVQRVLLSLICSIKTCL